MMEDLIGVFLALGASLLGVIILAPVLLKSSSSRSPGLSICKRTVFVVILPEASTVETFEAEEFEGEVLLPFFSRPFSLEKGSSLSIAGESLEGESCILTVVSVLLILSQLLLLAALYTISRERERMLLLF